MKKTLIFLVILVFPIMAQTWTRLGPENTSAYQIQPDPLSPDSVYGIVGNMTVDPPAVYFVRTPDCGASWDTLERYSGFTLHPETAETVFTVLGIGSFSDGVYRSDTYGAIFGFPPPIYLYMARCVAYDPVDPAYMFAGGSGIQRSTDGGRSWTSVYSSPGIFSIIGGIVVDPAAIIGFTPGMMPGSFYIPPIVERPGRDSMFLLNR